MPTTGLTMFTIQDSESYMLFAMRDSILSGRDW